MNVIPIARAQAQPTPAAEEPTHTGLLRFITAGNVDDGKSTLIGRLLYDSKSILADQLSAIERTSHKRGLAEIDWSLLTDGLQAEREQGITIDVAYRYFATARRKFIIGDAPGHEQYTRNMVTAASTADVAVILVDARKGVATQTRRHSYLARLVGIPRIVLAVNKMDCVDYDPAVFGRIAADYRALAGELGFAEVRAIPLSALKGDNVVERGAAMPWYDGPTLLEYLDGVPALHDGSERPLRFPVQRVARVMLGNRAIGLDAAFPAEFRGYQGTVAAGVLRVGDPVRVLPLARTTRVKSLMLAGQPLRETAADSAVVVELEDEVDISRGDMLAAVDAPPRIASEIEADLCWLAEEPWMPSRRYSLKHTTRTVRAVVRELVYAVDVNTLARIPQPAAMAMNDIVRAKLKLQQPILADTYAENRVTGSFILIDDATHDTVAAGVLV
ncbi:sulfate adenylyltransferase subunit 1 [Methylomagnum ishizawai]|uniref:sulfate adenylyltransferase n=1 Tax=Methylomagnum ishizawai TaxID=1760988 RepID=A0A1Y6D3W6_9GAMM|nr:GTP-binding protein [Methylomagnum ishizawai]SMF97639.1 sulfate adenylyltransferase subunit 1 [Methylomagnum ishizawai]